MLVSIAYVTSPEFTSIDLQISYVCFDDISRGHLLNGCCPCISDDLNWKK